MTAENQPVQAADLPSSIAIPRPRRRRAARRHEVAVVQAEVRRLARALRPHPGISGDALKQRVGDPRGIR
jgi:hypothetical protein